MIAATAHMRLAAPANNDGASILRRGYSYDNGISMIAERWPPWRHAMELDAGLLFICYQRDPRTRFIKIFDRMAKFDTLKQFVTHIGGGLFACPGGVAEGGYYGQRLFEQSDLQMTLQTAAHEHATSRAGPTASEVPCSSARAHQLW